EEPAPTRLREHRSDARDGRDRVEAPRPFPRRRALHGPLRAVRVGHRHDLRVARGVAGLAVDDERREVLDEIAGVQVDRVVELRDDLGEQMMREALSPCALRIAREEASEVVVVLRVDVNAALVEPGTVEERGYDDGAADVVWIDRPAETD